MHNYSAKFPLTLVHNNYVMFILSSLALQLSAVLVLLQLEASAQVSIPPSPYF